MTFWDYAVLADEDLPAIAETAKKLGLDGLCLLAGKPEVPDSVTDIAAGVLIEASKPDDVRKLARKSRKSHEIIAVAGTEESISRAAVETAEVDMLIPSGHTKIDITMAKLARKNNVCIAFSFSQLLQSSLQDRGAVFAQMLKNAGMVIRAKAPFLIVSGALSEYGLRSPSELTAFGSLLGFSGKDVRDALSARLIEENRKRLSKGWVMPGVEVEQ
ncbi:MAG: hypothetical protein J7K54_00035 [Candidatus Aenigmarchaeota archaeon]|nr:hypothetical protein [Candidatus Aenigmarchaeota archaeon]